MSKEVKIGLGVIFSLALTLGYTVYDRCFQGPPLADVAEVSENTSAEALARSPSMPLIVAAETSTTSVPRFDVAPAAQWEEATSESSVSPEAAPVQSDTPTTFRAVEKPVLTLDAGEKRSDTPSANAAPIAQVAGSGDAAKRYRPVPLSVQPNQQNEVRQVAARSDQTGGYQPPRVLSAVDSNAPQPSAPTQQTAQQPYTPTVQQPAAAQEAYQVPTREPSYGPPTQQQPSALPASQNTVPTEYRQAAQSASSHGNSGTYQVGPNDTFWTISQKVYGSGSFFKALARSNSAKYPRPDKLAVGDVVETPSQRDLMQQYPELCPKPRRAAAGGRFSSTSNVSANAANGRAYEVQEGDTLFDIARYELGDGSRWIEIHQLNQRLLTEDFDFIKPGMKIMLPGRGKPHKRKPESVARQQDGRRAR